MKRFTAVALSLCLLAGCLAGCGSTEIRSYSEDEKAAARDMSAAYKTYDPDTLVMTVNGDKITWQEYFYWINSIVLSLDSENGSQISDWTAQYSGSSGQTYAQFTLAQVKQAVLQYHVMDAKAKALGVTLSADEEAQLKSTLQSNITKYCGSDGTEDDFSAYLGTLYMTRDYYDYINRVMLLYYDTFDATMGAGGEKCTDDETMLFAEDNGYMTADHILISTKDADGNALSDAEAAKKQELAESIASQLKGITDHTALLKKFKELKDKYTEDTGAAQYPNGYCFTSGQMVDEFQDACETMKEYEISDPVKSEYGYHIILRLPTTPDDEVSYDSETGTTRTLRYYAAVDRYNSLVGTWIDEADVEWQPGFENLDIAALLKK
jgi:parvulin-like peptidyl-prolyl isomerase